MPRIKIPTKTEKLDIRVTPKFKKSIERAAKIKNVYVATFIREAIEKEIANATAE